MSALPPETERLIHDAIRRSDSLRHVTMPLLTPQQIRQAGTAATQETSTRRLPWLSAVITRRGLLTGAAAALAVVGTGIGLRLLLTPEPAIAAPAPLALNPRGERARDHLLDLATTLANQTPTPDTAAAVATHTRLQRWSIATTNYSGTIIAHDEQTWWYPDRSAHTVQTTLPSQPAEQQTAQYIDQLEPAWPQKPQDYPPGTFPIIIDDTAFTNPDQLAAQLAKHQPDNGPLGILRGIADLNEIHHLRPAQRIAALRLLAAIPDITWRGKTIDRAKRDCVAISLDSGDDHTGVLRDILLIAPNGTIYGHEQISLTPPSLSPDIPPNTVVAYTLYLVTEHLPI